MLFVLRRLRPLAALLVLSVCAGPAASALCPHAAGATPVPTEAPVLPPCHTPPGEAPAHHPAPPADEDPGADCASPCCAVAAPAPAPSTSAPDAPLALAPAPYAAGLAAPIALRPHRTPAPESSPPRAVLLYLLLGCFLT